MTEPITARTGTPNLNKALAAFQAEMPAIERDRKVDVETKDPSKAYSYSYATLANIVRVAAPIMGKHGLAFTSAPGQASDGKGISVRWALVHESGEERTGEFPISAEGGIQVLGGRITYVKRYCMCAALNIAADEDDDAAAAQAEDDANAGTVQRRPRQDAKPAATRKTRQTAPASAPEPGTAPSAATVQRTARTGPPLPNESPADEPTAKQKGMLGVLFNKELPEGLGVQDRDQRLAMMSDMLGRTITSINDLTKREASGAIDAITKALQTDNPFVTMNDIYQRTTGSGPVEDVDALATEIGRKPGQRSRNAREAIGTGDVGTEQAPWESGELPV
jgi:uncharacterized protein YunC (DUF1805 family)